ncbi:B3/B4 domain-containing protein [Ligilactobacillus aviarius]|uniref:B3/B4 domain-containing protein n=1 Tax=Ligilactobacillus aviarius TaxID=1606 RepID=UPI00242C9C28|nr:phenylalanine--tRNA ligase beta subunit-related protein [Ligilactobacillus aviarius]
MKKFILDESLFEKFPEAEIKYFTVDGINNHVDEKDDPYFEKLLADAKEESKKYIQDETFRNNPVVASWRKVYQQFKKKKGARSSIEAMLKRVSQGRDFKPIIPLVDLYNSISLRYGVPCGGEDLDQMDGNMHLGVTAGGDEFWPLGADDSEPTLPGEVCYYDQGGAICRCWNWREAKRTMLTEETTHAVLVTEAATKEQAANMEAAMEDLRKLVGAFFKVKPSEIVTLNHDNPSGEMK